MTIILLIIVVLLLATTVVLLLWLRNLAKKVNLLNSQQQAQELLYSELQNTIEQYHQANRAELTKQLQNHTEIEQISRQLEHRIKTLQQKCEQTDDKIVLLEQQQPEDKLYSRALKLVALGADVEEVMRECEMPRVEAELLFSIHQNQAQD